MPSRGAPKLSAALYEELRRIAGHQLARERSGHSLEARDLVHEACLRLLAQERVAWQDRAALRCAAAATMRRVLVDEARARKARKRGRGARRLPVETLEQLEESDGAIGLAAVMLEDALQRLAVASSRCARIARLHVTSGMELSRVAAVLGVSLSTIEREWRRARAWLAVEGRRRAGRCEPSDPRMPPGGAHAPCRRADDR